MAMIINNELLSGKMTTKGQLTIPKELREMLGIEEGDQIKFIIDKKKGEIKVEPYRPKKLSEILKNRIKVDESIDIEKIREVAQIEFAEEFIKKQLRDQ